MLFQLFFFFLLLAIIFMISRKIHSLFYSLVFVISASQKIAVSILALIILPGTVIHEMSHFLLASILRVPTGELSVIPTIDEKTGEVKAGKLMLGKSDPFRHTLIGLAPTVIGLVLIYIIGKIFFLDLSKILNTKYLILNTLGIYLLFVVSTTMFSSKKDMESLKIALPIVLLVILALYFIGLRISLTGELIKKVEFFISQLNGYLLISAILNFLIWVFLVLNLKLWQRLLKR